MNNTSRFETVPGLAGDTLLLTAGDGLVSLADLAGDLSEGQVRPLSLRVRGDDVAEDVTGVVCCGTRSAYRITLEGGMTFVATYGSEVVTARNRHSTHHRRKVDDLDVGETLVVPRGKCRMGRYDGRSWSESMLERGAFPSQVLAGSDAYLRKVVRTTLLEPAGGIGEGIRSTLSVDSENGVTLSWRAPNKWLARQLQTLLVPFANVMATLDADATEMRVTDADLVRLDDATGVIDGIYEEGECDADRQVVDWLLGVIDTHTRMREVARVSEIEGVNRRPMYALVMGRPDASFVANGVLHGAVRNAGRLDLEEVTG